MKKTNSKKRSGEITNEVSNFGPIVVSNSPLPLDQQSNSSGNKKRTPSTKDSKSATTSDVNRGEENDNNQ